MKAKGARLVVDALLDTNVEVIFTLPGFFIMDVLYELKQTSIKVIVCRNEMSAAFAADGYARASGRPGFVLVNTGPSCLNTLSALKTSYKDQIPVVIIVGTDDVSRMNNEAEFQTTVFPDNIVQYVFTATIENVYELIKKGIDLSLSEPHTPVLIQVPRNVSKGECLKHDALYISSSSADAVERKIERNLDIQKNFTRLIEELNQASRRLVIVGGGVVQSDSQNFVQSFIHRYNIQVVCTATARGAINIYDRLFLGNPGILGTDSSNKAIEDSDLLIAIGSRLSRRFLAKVDISHKVVFQVNLQESHIRSDLKVIPIICGAEEILHCLLETDQLKEKRVWCENTEIIGQLPVEKVWGTTLALTTLFEVVDNPVVFCDDGTYTIKTIQLYQKAHPRHLLFSGNMAAGGQALPGAIGAKLADKSKKVFAIIGDGGILSVIGELQVYSDTNLEIVVLLFNNGGYKSINLWSEKQAIPLNLDFSEIDFTTIARGFGLKACTVESADRLKNILKDYQWDEPLFLNLLIPSEVMISHFPD